MDATGDAAASILHAIRAMLSRENAIVSDFIAKLGFSRSQLSGFANREPRESHTSEIVH